MFKQIENFEFDRKFSKFDYIKYIPAESLTINTSYSQININIPREDSVRSLLNSYLEVNFEFIKKIGYSRYANGKDIRLVFMGPTALFSKFELTMSSGNI